MLACCAKFIDGAIFCVGVASETCTLIADLYERKEGATSLVSKTAALFFRLFSRNAASTDLQLGMKVCEGAARTCVLLTADPKQGAQGNYQATAALAGMARCFVEACTISEKSLQEYALAHPDEQCPIYEKTCQMYSTGSSFETSCTNKVVGYQPYDIEASKLRETGGAALGDFLATAETTTHLHQMLSRGFRDIEFEPQIDRPPVPILQSIPQPTCPITKQPIQEPCRDKNDPNRLFEYQALIEAIDAEKEPVTQDAIELVKFAT